MLKERVFDFKFSLKENQGTTCDLLFIDMSRVVNIDCKNKSCSNKIVLFESEIGKKLFCSRKCRGIHHNQTTPILEKMCYNPDCNIIIKRKFKTQLAKIKYCSVVCKKNYNKIIKIKRENDIVKSNCKNCNVDVITKRQSCGKLIPRTLCNLCKKEANQNKTKKMTDTFNKLYKTNIEFKNKMKRAFKKNGELQKEKNIKYGLPKKWIHWYKTAFDKNKLYGGRSTIENKVIDYINNKYPHLKIQQTHNISNMFVDVYIPEKRIVIECQGNYWHMNPTKYKTDDYNKSTKLTAGEHWVKDKKRKIFLESLGYIVIQLWEDEINRDNYSNLDTYLL